MSFNAEVNELVQTLCSPVAPIISNTLSNQAPKPAFQPTVPKPFNLSKPNISPLLQPPHEYKYQPVSRISFLFKILFYNMDE